jgi:hypothetical protein
LEDFILIFQKISGRGKMLFPTNSENFTELGLLEVVRHSSNSGPLEERSWRSDVQWAEHRHGVEHTFLNLGGAAGGGVLSGTLDARILEAEDCFSAPGGFLTGLGGGGSGIILASGSFQVGNLDTFSVLFFFQGFTATTGLSHFAGLKLFPSGDERLQI